MCSLLGSLQETAEAEFLEASVVRVCELHHHDPPWPVGYWHVFLADMDWLRHR